MESIILNFLITYILCSKSLLMSRQATSHSACAFKTVLHHSILNNLISPLSIDMILGDNTLLNNVVIFFVLFLFIGIKIASANV
jgi:hypothetical protein